MINPSKNWYALEVVALLIREFIKIILIQSYLGPDLFGVYTAYLALFIISSPILNLGLGHNLAAAMGKHSLHTDDICASLVGLRIASGLIVGLIVCFVALTIPELQLDTYSGLLFIFAVAQLFQVGPLLHGALQQDHRFRLSAYISTTVTIVSLVATVLMIAIGVNINWIASLLILESIIGTALLIVAIKPTVWIPKTHIIRLLLVGALPITIVGVTIVGYKNIDVIILKSMVGSCGIDDYEIGLYGAAVKYTALAIVPGMAIATALRPNINVPDKVNIDLAVSNTAVVVGRVSILCSVLLFAMGPTVAILFSGSDYAPCGKLIRLLSPTVVLVNSILVFTWANVAYGTRLHILLGSVCALFTNILLNFLLIPKYGASGAAIATLVSYPVALIPGLLLSQGNPEIRRAVISSITGIPVRGHASNKTGN